ncbi:hypothetical protein RHM66_16335 [Pseudomonas sp. RTB3]|nr:hypothetical protein RHM66_16335 [Pseudomonas sp. RTB3]
MQMVEVWNRLSEDKQALLLKRFGTQENALAALVASQLLAPASPDCGFFLSPPCAG